MCYSVPCLLSSAVTITLYMSTGLIAGIVVVCVVVYLLTFLAGCGGGVLVIEHIVYQKKTKQSTCMLCVGRRNKKMTSSVGVSITSSYICKSALMYMQHIHSLILMLLYSQEKIWFIVDGVPLW